MCVFDTTSHGGPTGGTHRAAPQGVHAMATPQGNAGSERQRWMDMAESDLRLLKSMRI